MTARLVLPGQNLHSGIIGECTLGIRELADERHDASDSELKEEILVNTLWKSRKWVGTV
jgi:hypothetical protein